MKPPVRGGRADRERRGRAVSIPAGCAPARGAAADETGEAFPQRIQVAESIEKGELFCGMEQGLMVVGSVNVHQPFAEGGERVRGGGGPVDELAVGAGRAEGAFEDELA